MARQATAGPRVAEAVPSSINQHDVTPYSSGGIVVKTKVSKLPTLHGVSLNTVRQYRAW